MGAFCLDGRYRKRKHEAVMTDIGWQMRQTLIHAAELRNEASFKKSHLPTL